jgi:alpha-1,2-mannosyltransferase
MQDEHFGISIIEFMAAGLPVVAHRSGGPEKDILPAHEKLGFLASDADEFSTCIDRAVSRFESLEIRDMIKRSTSSLSRFLDDEEFGARFAKLSV